MASTKPHTTARARTGTTKPGHAFTPTSWTAIYHASNPSSPETQQALAQLCRSYWEPLHAYTRRLGYKEQDTKDLIQEFFLRLLQGNFFGTADRKKGKFRSFLLTALNHFLSDQRKRAAAAKRGGGQATESLDECDEDGQPFYEASTDLSPDKIFERRWALTVFQQTFARLREEYVAARKGALFEKLKAFLESSTDQGGYNDVAAELKMTVNAVGVSVHRMRHRFGELVREEVIRTLANPTDKEISAEVRHIYDTLSQ